MGFAYRRHLPVNAGLRVQFELAAGDVHQSNAAAKATSTQCSSGAVQFRLIGPSLGWNYRDQVMISLADMWHSRVGGRPCLPCTSSRNDTNDFGTVFALAPALRRQGLRDAARVAY